jgi:hypothetical protein
VACEPTINTMATARSATLVSNVAPSHGHDRRAGGVVRSSSESGRRCQSDGSRPSARSSRTDIAT